MLTALPSVPTLIASAWRDLDKNADRSLAEFPPHVLRDELTNLQLTISRNLPVSFVDAAQQAARATEQAAAAQKTLLDEAADCQEFQLALRHSRLRP